MEKTKMDEHKKSSIINAAYRLFAINGYKNTTTDMITNEAKIAKGLLFYYFKSKKDLYEYLYHHSVDVIMNELEKNNYEEITDFFDFILKSQELKWQVMQKNHFIFQFLISVVKDENKETEDLIPKQFDDVQSIFKKFIKRVDKYKFKDENDIEKIVSLIVLSSKGASVLLSESKEYDLELEKKKWQEIILMLKKNSYKEEYL